MSSILSDRCANCGESLRRALLSALLSDAGAQLSWDPVHCPDGQEHNFVSQETQKPDPPEKEE